MVSLGAFYFFLVFPVKNFANGLAVEFLAAIQYEKELYLHEFLVLFLAFN